jgi:DNA-binding CsgD family transcriptional regulator
MYSQFDNMSHEELIIKRTGQGVKLCHSSNDSHCNQLTLNKMFSMPFNAFFIDLQSAVRAANEAVPITFNTLSIEDTIGLTVKDVAKNDSVQFSLQHDQSVISTNRMIIKDELYNRLDDTTFPLLTIKFPWYEQSDLIGIFGICIMIDKKYGVSLADSISMLTQTGLLNTEITQNQLLPGLSYGDIYFTQREKEILFHLVRGKSAKSIAHVFRRSPRTIEQHIENMKFKTESHSKAELIDKIINDYLK